MGECELLTADPFLLHLVVGEEERDSHGAVAVLRILQGIWLSDEGRCGKAHLALHEFVHRFRLLVLLTSHRLVGARAGHCSLVVQVLSVVLLGE